MANTVSAVLSPPVLGTAMIAIAAVATQQVAAWAWACTALALNVLAPIGYLLWLLKQGLVSDLDVQNRTERARPLSFTLAAMLITVLVLRLLNAPSLLLAVCATQLIQTALALVITLRWKISMHSAACAACFALLVFVMGRQAVPLLLALPLVGWSRIYLRRHTPAQTIAGAALGGLITWGTLTWSTIP
ncbi:MAG: phosphatase PAP2 family protein [Anaerolineae bacterium]